MRRLLLTGLASLIAFLFVGDILAQTIAFPTAKGYGRFATGGRGGHVAVVTTLEDYNPATEAAIPGSFRWAFTQGRDSVKGRYGWEYFWKPLTVVFQVGGVIDLKTDFSLNRDGVTIAGQTALGNGICFRGYTLKFGGPKNAIIRYIKSRPGDVNNVETSAARWENGSNFIFDHCSFSWGIEETTHFSSAKDFTIQWCIVSEGLYSSIHKKGNRGYAAQWGGQYSTYHHNLLAHNQSRSPRVNGANKNDVYSLVDIRNNVNYNLGSSGACYGGEWEVGGGRGFAHTNMVNNYYKPGPAASSINFASPSYARSGVTPDGYGLWYFEGNYMHGNAGKTNDNWTGVDTGNVGGKNNIYSATEFVRDDAVSTGGAIEDYASYTETALEAYESVLVGVGANYPVRDWHDTRIIGEITGEIPIRRSQHLMDGVLTNPAKGLNSGIIDSPWNLKPADAPADWDPWYSYYPAVDASEAPLDTDKDGMPDAWEQANGLNPNDAEDRNKVTKSGYTALEVYLNGLVGEEIKLEFEGSEMEDVQLPTLTAFVEGNRLTLLSDANIVDATVYSMLGEMYCTAKGTQLRNVDIANLLPGFYLVKVTTADKKQVVCKFRK